jgi:hypothetical protein
MKWIRNSNDSVNEHYILVKENDPVLKLKFNTHTNTARVQCDNEKRAFIIQRAGLPKNKVFIQNEYGFDMGQLVYENNSGNAGVVQIEHKRYKYNLHTAPLIGVKIYRESDNLPVVNCELDNSEIIPSTDFSNNHIFEKSYIHAALLMVLCWYLFLPASKQKAEPAY